MKDADKKRILLIDDHPVVRAGIKHTLEAAGDFIICGELERPEEAVACIRSRSPDLVLLDISLGAVHGVELIKQLGTTFPDLPVLVLSMHDESVYAPRALRAGARGYIAKQEAPARLVAAVRQVLSGGIAVSEPVSRKMLQLLSGTPGTQLSLPSEILSDRELEVFELLGRGYGSREIADSLGLSFKTVNSHRENVKAKLHIKSGQELVRQAIQWTQLEHATEVQPAPSADRARPRTSTVAKVEN